MKLVKLTDKHYAVVADCGKKYEYISAAEAEEAINGYAVYSSKTAGTKSLAFEEGYIQSLQQTEWPCKFENGKLVIL